MNLPSHGGLDDLLLWICLDDDTVLAQLFLDQNNLLCPIDDEVAAGIQGTLVQNSHLCRRLIGQYTLGTAKHDRHATNSHTTSENPLSPSQVLKIDKNRRSVSCISESTLLRGHVGLKVDTDILRLIRASRRANVDVRKLDIELVIDIAANDGA